MATRSRPRSRSTDSPARIVEHEENNSSGLVTSALCLRHPRLLARPLPRLRGAYHHPPLLWSSRLVLGEVDAHFLEIGEVLIVSPSLIALANTPVLDEHTWTFGILAAGQGIVIYVAGIVPRATLQVKVSLANGNGKPR